MSLPKGRKEQPSLFRLNPGKFYYTYIVFELIICIIIIQKKNEGLPSFFYLELYKLKIPAKRNNEISTWRRNV